MADSARLLAARRLLRVEEEGAYVSRLTKGGDVNRRAIALVAGVTRWKRWLDHVAGRFVRGGIGRLDAPVLHALRIGTFELVVEGVPAHAAVGEAVGVARELSHKGGAGLVNAVLRKVAGVARNAPEGPQTGDPADDLAVRWSHPTWMVRRWLDRWGEGATRDLLERNNAVPRYSLRVNPLRTTGLSFAARLEALGVEPEPGRWSEASWRVSRLQPVVADGLLRDGHCAVQDEAATLVGLVLDPQPGESVLDGAAAPGGKALHAAERMGNEGAVLAVDRNAAKADLVAVAAAAHGATIVRTVAADLRQVAAAHAGRHDRVLLDAPCSGTGVLAKRADLRWRRTPGELAELTALQDELLDAAALAVAPGGLLVYATCSLEPEENEARVAAFIERTPSFILEPVPASLPEPLRDGAFYRALPHLHGTDGAFAARLRHVPDPR